MCPATKKKGQRATHTGHFPSGCFLLDARSGLFLFAACGDGTLLCDHFSFMGEVSRGQSSELRAVSYRWSSQTFKLSSTFEERLQGGGVNSRCCLSADIRSGPGVFIRENQDVIFVFHREESLRVLLGWPRPGHMVLFGT